jgi:hypothetical protein
MRKQKRLAKKPAGWVSFFMAECFCLRLKKRLIFNKLKKPKSNQCGETNDVVSSLSDESPTWVDDCINGCLL